MAAQFGRALPASLQAPSFGTGATSARPLLRAPHNVRLDGTIHRSLMDARVPSHCSVWRLAHFVMAEDAAGATFLFDAAQGNLLEVLVEENGAPPTRWNRDKCRQDLWRYYL